MKHKLAIAVLASVLFSGSAVAGGYYGGHRNYGHHHHDSGRWVAPLIIGGAIGYAISESNRQRVYVAPTPIYVTPPPPPPVYVEPARSSYWYYCPTSEAYYPYVGSCAAPWVRVIPN